MEKDRRRITRVLRNIIYFLILSRTGVILAEDIRIGIVAEDEIDLNSTQLHVTNVLQNEELGRVCPASLPKLTWLQLKSVNQDRFDETVNKLVCDGIHAVVSVCSRHMQTRLARLFDSLQLPHVAVDVGIIKPRSSHRFTVYTSPSYVTNNEMVLDVLRTVVQETRWKTTSIIVDTVKRYSDIENWIWHLSSIFVETHLIHIVFSSSEDHVRLQLTKARDRGLTNFVIISDRTTYTHILQQANSLKMLGLNYFWIVFFHEDAEVMLDATFQQYSSSNILIVKHHWIPITLCCFPGYYQSNHLPMEKLTLSEMKVMEAISLLYKAVDASLKKPFSEINVHCNGNQSWVNDSYNTNGSNDVMASLKKGSNDGFTTTKGFDEDGNLKSVQFDLYSTVSLSSKPIRHIGVWKVGTGVKKDNPFFLNQFVDFGGREIPVAALEQPPFYEKVEVDGKTIHTGLCIEILNELAYMLNFSYRIVQPADGTYGEAEEEVNGSWTGMVGMVLRGEVVMAAGPFTVTSDRAQVIDFSKSYLEVSTSILSKKLDLESHNLLQVFRPFTLKIWICIAAAVIGVGIISALINWCSPYETHITSSSIVMASFENIWSMYSSLVEQGPTFYPTSTSGRVMLAFWWVFCTLLVSMYTAVLAAYLTVSYPSPQINSIQDLQQHTSTGVLVIDGSNTHSLFRESNLTTYQAIWERIQGSPVIRDEAKAVELVMVEDYVYISDITSIEYIVSKKCGSLIMAKDNFNKASYAFVLPKDAPYLEAISHSMLKLLEAGLVEVWKTKWLGSSEHCVSTLSAGHTTLHLHRVGGVFIIYTIVTGSAILLIFCGILWKKFSGTVLRKSYSVK